MDFHSTGFWLLWLTFVTALHNQLPSADGRTDIVLAEDAVKYERQSPSPHPQQHSLRHHLQQPHRQTSPNESTTTVGRTSDASINSGMSAGGQQQRKHQQQQTRGVSELIEQGDKTKTHQDAGGGVLPSDGRRKSFGNLKSAKNSIPHSENFTAEFKESVRARLFLRGEPPPQSTTLPSFSSMAKATTTTEQRQTTGELSPSLSLSVVVAGDVGDVGDADDGNRLTKADVDTTNGTSTITGTGTSEITINIGNITYGSSLKHGQQQQQQQQQQQREGQFPPLPIERRHIVPGKLQYTKEIAVKQGRLIGIVRNFHASTGLRDVDQYLGLPYAEAPVGSRRFMPPGAPLPWQGVKIARHLPPVCPQKLPDLSQDNVKMSPGRLRYLQRLMPYLKTESEDCLYLNVYVPKEEQSSEDDIPIGSRQLYPVLMYIHGESFEWNSGNAYDGSVLASYGQVIVVTVNFRLGVLGFMKPTISDQSVANFGLLDQIAALHWIKENIGSFGGDRDSVTLMGHSTGAACVNYLMMSPVASGLFHRSILMSGSAMSDWAVSNHSLQLTIQIAHALNCPLNDDNEEMLSCLRLKSYQDILRVPTTFPKFSTPLGPIVDGHVIPNQPYKVMGQYTEHFGRYDLLFGVTELESYHTLGVLALEQGLREHERDNLLRFYMQSHFDVRPDLALAATLKKYSDLYNNPIRATNMEHRDVVLDILSDARVVGPLIQAGLFHAEVNRRNYMYVFGHNSASGPHASLPHSVAGEELAFVFGAPLAMAGPFHSTYNAQEKLLAEAVMAYWTNFARSGNPKAPWKGTFINLHGLEWDRYDLDWPEFNKRSQAYINIGIPPSIGYKYRQIYMNFWNKELPDELNQIADIQHQPFVSQAPRGGPFMASSSSSSSSSSSFPARTGGMEVITGQMQKYGSRDNVAEDPVHTLKLLLQEPYGQGNALETAENMYNAPPTFGVAKHSEDEAAMGQTVPNTNVIYGNPMKTERGFGIAATTSATAATDLGQQSNQADRKEEVAKSETTIQLLIGLIVVFIVLNVVIYSTFLLHKKKKTKVMNRKFGGILSYDAATDDEFKRSKTQNDGDDSFVLDMARKSNTYEAVLTDRSPINGYKMTRQLSSSTVDTHTKVSEWISSAGKQVGTLSRGGNFKKSSSPTFSSLRGSSGAGSFKQPLPHKVSVAVDATPQARSDSVLRQEPIEVSRIKADGRKIIICQDVEIEDHEMLTPQDTLESDCRSLMRQHSAATEACEAELGRQPQYPELHIEHKHSRSDPVDLLYYSNEEKVTSFVDDINVTSRDSDNSDGQSESALTTEERLMTLKRRRYPKVLPTDRATDSPPMTADLSTTYKRNSLPPNSFTTYFYGRQAPPMPPPRTISTIGRRPLEGRRDSNNITTSPLMLASDCTEEDEDEPEITQNTLMVGPIVPKTATGECNYSTLKRSRQANEVDDTTVAPSENGLDEPLTETTMSPTFEWSPPPLSTEAENDKQGEQQHQHQHQRHQHHTEKVYSIEPAKTATVTPTTSLTNASAPSEDSQVIYAQPMKASAMGRSCIPRMIAPISTTSTSPAASTAITQATNSPVGAPPAFIMRPITPTSATRIPTLNRNLKTTNSSNDVPADKTSIPTVVAAEEDEKFASKDSRNSSSESSSSASSMCRMSSYSSTSSSSSSSTGTVRTELQQQQK